MLRIVKATILARAKPYRRLWAAAPRLVCAALLLVVSSHSARANTCYAATTQGTAPSNYQAYCWLDFTGYSDSKAQSSAGQAFSFALSDGSSLTLTLQVSTNAASPALLPVSVPSWSGAAFGNSAFLGISGKPVLYQAQGGSTVHVTLSNIVLTPPPGTGPAGSYGFVAADGESTNGGESLSFTTNGQAWTEMAQIPNGSAYPGLAGVGTSTVTETGVGGTVGSYAFQTLNSPTQVSSVLVGSGLQGALFGIRYGSVVVNSQLSGTRANAADQFKYGVTTTGGTVIAAATSTGSGAGPYAAASVPTIAGNYSFLVTESMATGSVSPLNYYVPSLTCTNSNTGSTTALPTNVITTSYSFSGLADQDAISCVFSNTVSPAYVPNHFAISTPVTAVNCQAAAVTVTAHTSTHAALGITSTMTLSTSTGHGDWSLTTGSGAFVAGAANSGTASYTFAAADAGVAVFALRDTYAETVTINAVDGTVSTTTGTALAAEHGPLTFVSSGFIVTNGANVPTAIATQIAGVTSTQSLALQAVRTDTRTGACTALFASGATVNVGLGLQCNNPMSCVAGQSFTVTNNGISTAIVANNNGALVNYTTVPLRFSTAAAEAPIAISYSDAGQVTLAAKYTIPLANGASSPNALTGGGQFVVQPYSLQLGGIVRSQDGFANPGSTTASGAAFIGAGQSFSAAVTARNASGNATPNFGQETTTTAVVLTPALVLPTSGDLPPVAGSFAGYAGGSATGTAFSWPEVGIITLTPTVANYLGSGAITGQTSVPVGRFVPNNFLVAENTPVFATACAAGGFTYVGEPFGYAVAPVITVTAQALGGTTTLNYAGSLFRLTNNSLTARTYAAAASGPGLSLAGLPASSSDPAIASLGNGQGTLTFSAGSGISFVRGNPIAPFNASIALSINVIDLDGVSATANPVSFGAGNGIAFSTGAAQYYGRLRLSNVVGSELLDLPMSLVTQYYLSAASGFTSNTNDVCTTAPALGFSNFQLNLKTLTTRSIASSAVAGQFNLVLAAPGSGNAGAATVTATAPAWLQYLWNTASGVSSNPVGIATFGVFPGPSSRIYQREVY